MIFIALSSPRALQVLLAIVSACCLFSIFPKSVITDLNTCSVDACPLCHSWNSCFVSLENALMLSPIRPSARLIPNSFTKSFTLSRLYAPESRPFCRIVNISSAENPACDHNWEYSARLSVNSPDLSSPFCAPFAT